MKNRVKWLILYGIILIAMWFLIPYLLVNVPNILEVYELDKMYLGSFIGCYFMLMLFVCVRILIIIIKNEII